MFCFQEKKIPFAAALGLSMTAKKVAKVEQLMMVNLRQGTKKTDYKIRPLLFPGLHNA